MDVRIRKEDIIPVEGTLGPEGIKRVGWFQGFDYYCP